MKVELLASPDKLTPAGSGADVSLLCQNVTFTPLTYRLVKLYSNNTNVAALTSTSATPLDINVSRRDKQSLFAKAVQTTKKIATWSAAGQGYTDLIAEVEILDQFGRLLRARKPSDDVQVT